MLLLGERSEQTEPLAERLRRLSDKLFEGLPAGEPLSLNACDDLYALYSTENLFFLRQGTLQGYHQDRLCCHFESGDLIGLTDCYQLPSLRLVSDSSLVLEQYPADQVLRHAVSSREQQSIWTSYLITHIAVFMDAFGNNKQEVDDAPNTGFLNFLPGDTIITEGDAAHDVFTILRGKADVFVKGAKVGEILQDEIFGAMAVFTNEPRSATVIAAEPCTILAVPKDEFITLIKSHPDTTLALIENMARNIQALNKKLTEQSV
ncbi:MAG: Crp/Fnr family transcriptional regulator [Saccharospirillum sp.]|jgi:hypothetical protein